MGSSCSRRRANDKGEGEEELHEEEEEEEPLEDANTRRSEEEQHEEEKQEEPLDDANTRRSEAISPLSPWGPAPSWGHSVQRARNLGSTQDLQPFAFEQ